MRICRFRFYHEYYVTVFARQAPRRKCAQGASCLMCITGARVHPSVDALMPFVHPKFCPPPAMVGVEKKFLRRGKALVLPRERCPCAGVEVEHFEEVGGLDYRPHVSTEGRYGNLGRVLALRYNPCVSSSNPAGQVLLRCNWDVQCFDRVHVENSGTTVSPAALNGGGPGGSDDEAVEAWAAEAGGSDEVAHLAAPSGGSGGGRSG